MTRKELSARAANILRAVASSTACTPATIESLRSFLAPGDLPLQQQKKAAVKGVQPRRKPATAPPVKAAGARARKQPAVAILEVPGEGQDAIQAQDRVTLATEVANVTLKTLTEAIKRPPVQQKRTPLARSSSNVSFCNGLNSRSQTLLQPLCANRVTDSPSKPSHLRRSSSTASVKDTFDGIRAQAECARVAYATLRSMQGSNELPALPPLQLESGMSALITKLIALGFDDLAVKELRILRRRLENSGEPSTRAKPTVSEDLVSEGDKLDAKGETLPCMLKFRNIDAKGPLLALIIASQLHVLRILALRRDGLAIESCLQHLELDVAYSPAILIQKQIDSQSPESEARAARQLESLAQLLLALCPLSSSTNHSSIVSPSNALPPETAFRVQVLALRIRYTWWNLSGHRSNVSLEMVGPFTRYLAAFHRKSRLGRNEKYGMAKSAFHVISICVQNVIGFQDEMFYDVYQSLATLAQDALEYSEAVRWVRKSSINAVQYGASRTQLCTLACRTATLHLRTANPIPDEEILKSLKDAASALAGDLQGGSAELDELLIVAACLRKSSFSVVQDSLRNLSTAISDIAEECRNVVLLCLKFMIRYVGNGSGPADNDKTLARREQRKRAAGQVAGPAVESVVAMARLAANASSATWETLEAGLRDCFELATRLDGAEKEPTASQIINKQSPSCFVSISNAYWYRFLRLKPGAVDARKLRECLRASIDILKDRSTSEKIQGSLPTKLERYGQIYENLHEYGKAADAYQEALSTQIESGLLEKATEAAATRPLPLVFESEGELGPFSRMLLAYPSAALKDDASGQRLILFCDPEGLCASERGTLLEQQFSAMVSVLLDIGCSATICKALSELAEDLLSLYTSKAYPVRRLRVVIRCLGLLLSSPGALNMDLQELLLQESNVEPTSTHFDTNLMNFLPHLTTSRKILVALHREGVSLEIMGTAVASWLQLVQEYPDWDALQTQVYDISDWLVQLELLAEHFEMHSLDMLRVSVLHLLVTIHEAATSVQCSVLILKLSALATQYSRLGYSGRAGIILQKAQRYLESSDITAATILRWHLSYAEHALMAGNLSLCKENLMKAEELYNNSVKLRPGMIGARALSEQSQLIADACYLRSLLAQAEEQPPTALFFARLSIKNCNQAWTVLARSHGKPSKTARKAIQETNKDLLVESMSELSISEDQAAENTITPYSSLDTIAFWSLVPRLCRGHMHISSLFAHHGLIPEVLYYLGQAQKIAGVVNTPIITGQCLATAGQLSIRQGGAAEGASLLQQAETILCKMPQDQKFAAVQSMLAAYYTRSGKSQAGEAAFATAEKLLQKLTTTDFLNGLVHKRPEIEILDVQMQLLTLEKPKPVRQPATRQGRPVSKKSTIALANQQRPSTLLVEAIPAIEAITLTRSKGELLRDRIPALLYEGRIDRAAILLGNAAAYPCDQRNVVLQALLTSRIRLRQGLDRLISDPVFCVLHESTISCPSTRPTGGSWRRQSASQEPKSRTKITTSTTQRNKGPAKKMRPRSPSMSKVETDFLRLAHSGMKEVLSLARKVSSTKTLHEITDVLGRILLMLSATSSTSRNPISANLLAYVLEMGRILSMCKESAVILVEQNLSESREAHRWPAERTFETQETCIPTEGFDFANFQAEYVDIIPASWTAISITLSESREDILICKMRADQTPFVVRLPLDRHSSELECDEEGFGFDQGKAELQDIITLANRSTHGAEELSHKGAKTEWWEARNALDARLKDLLNNIETMWLGGFKGIFSQGPQNFDLLSRLQQSLQNILDKHLPSRQKSGKGHQSSRVLLDSHVLELFVGLGQPSESNDVDEPLTDILNFVVDILQFNGERNAYDEVDFDSIAIETIDALRQYHQAVQEEAHSGSNQHTILILDKSLHCFPWESLPCLDGRSVSRLPSLSCLRSRILQQRKQQEQRGIPPVVENSLQVSRHNGSWILNPAGDLTATQEKLEGPLQELSGWEPIMQRKPTEAEMKSCLEDHELFLYFGHGSGGQYIRSRTIKRLDNCAVALLMGCSSGALTEAGEFEPYGTPMNYMQAGCPALLATLWDVTDKDIDRFSYRVLDKWGLFERPQPQSSPVKKSAKQRGKSKVRDVESTRIVEKSKMSLDQAVAESRTSCNLRYLNGAAPVVYGVPVYIA